MNQRFIACVVAVFACVWLSACSRSETPLRGGDSGSPAETSRQHVQENSVQLVSLQVLAKNGAGVQAMPIQHVGPDQAIRVRVVINGSVPKASLEVRLGDTKGNGLFREHRDLKVYGRTELDFEIAPPGGAWEPGTYQVLCVLNDQAMQVVSFTV